VTHPCANPQANAVDPVDDPKRRSHGHCSAAQGLRRRSGGFNPRHAANCVKQHRSAAPVLTDPRRGNDERSRGHTARRRCRVEQRRAHAARAVATSSRVSAARRPEPIRATRIVTATSRSDRRDEIECRRGSVSAQRGSSRQPRVLSRKRIRAARIADAGVEPRSTDGVVDWARSTASLRTQRRRRGSSSCCGRRGSSPRG